METQQKTNNFENYIVYIAVLLLPVIVISTFSNSFIIPKLAFLTFLLGLILIAKSVRNILRNSISFSASPLDLPVLLLGSAFVASSILQTPNKMEAFFLPGGATMIVAGIITFFVVNQMQKSEKLTLRYYILGAGVLASIAVLLASTGVFKSVSSLPFYIQSTSFTTLGGPLATLIMLIAVSPIGVFLLIAEKDIAKRAFVGISLTLIAFAALVSLVNVLPTKDTAPQLPGFNTSWLVAIDSMKQSPLLGVGPGNYLTAFNRFRPISYNSSDQWATRFTSGQSFVLTTITETGVFGAAAIILLFIFIFKSISGFYRGHRTFNSWMSSDGAIMTSLIILTGSLLLFPATISIIVMFFVVLALSTTTSDINMNMFNAHSQKETPFAARIPVLVATLPVIAAVLIYGFQASRVLSADMTYKSALDKVAKNDGRGAYDTLQKAINQNPYVDRYRVSYAQINLILANAIAKKENISDEDRQAIAQLVQQAIREGKVAVTLNPERAGNWEVLASIYRAVMPLAQGADGFAVQTYTQAVALDPLNVNTRIALGGVYYSAKAYEDAIDVFKLAVAIKPNHANAHYNLAVAYRENGDLDRAIAQMGTVLSLVDRNSEDYKAATKALEDMQNKKKAGTPEGGNLTAPDANGEVPALEEPIALPEDAAPPQAEEPALEASPAPTEEANPTPTPQP